MTDSEREQVNHLVPSDVKERAKENAAYGELSEAVRDVYRLYASPGGTETLAQLEVRLRRVRRERESLEDRIAALESELDEVRTREGELQDQIREYERETTEYERVMAELSEALHDGESVFPDHGKVKTAAGINGCSPMDIIEELQERNPKIPTEQFREGVPDPGPELSVIRSDTE